MTAIALRGVGVVIEGRDIVAGVDLDVPPGEWLALVGPNGAGKTTLLRAIAGLVPHSGELTLAGADPRTLSRRRFARQVAVVPQQPVVPAGMTVAEYVLLGRTPFIPYLGVETRHDRAVVADVLVRLDLAQLADRRLGSLSGGEFQRSVLARALAQQAPLLLLDEPTSALDVGHAQEVMELVDGLRLEHGLTVVSALHDLTTAGQFADRLLLLAAGRAIICGRAEDVLTETTISEHYGARVRVLDLPDAGIVVVPRRVRRGTEVPDADVTEVGG